MDLEGFLNPPGVFTDRVAGDSAEALASFLQQEAKRTLDKIALEVSGLRDRERSSPWLTEELRLIKCKRAQETLEETEGQGRSAGPLLILCSGAAGHVIL